MNAVCSAQSAISMHAIGDVGKFATKRTTSIECLASISFAVPSWHQVKA